MAQARYGGDAEEVRSKRRGDTEEMQPRYGVALRRYGGNTKQIRGR